MKKFALMIVLSLTLGFVCTVNAQQDSGTPNFKIPDFYQKQIERNRMSYLTVKVVDSEYKPVAEAKVTADMQNHEFMFGTAVRAKALIDPELDKYRQAVLELFNTVVFGNSNKWKYWECAEWRERTDKAYAWVKDHKLRFRGHTLLWQTLKYGCPMPEDIEKAVRGGQESDREYVRQRVLSHILNEAAELGDYVEHWDVVNEHVTENDVCKFLTPDTPHKSSDLVDWYKAADVAAPKAKLYTNDFHILVGDKAQHKDTYYNQIKFLIDSGAPVDGIGYQCHYYNGNLRRTREQLWETLNRFGEFDLPMTITEYDAFGKNWGEESELARAEFLHRLLTTFFAHPKAEGFMVWGFWSGKHWANCAPFYDKDWSEKIALAVYKDLVFKQWWSNEQSETNQQGQCTFHLFNGDYKITVTVGDKSYNVNGKASKLTNEIIVRIPGE